MQITTNKGFTLALVVFVLMGTLGLVAGHPIAAAAPKSEIAIVQGQPAPIDVNEAAVAELVQVKGIGPALAQKIVDHRASHGPFQSLDDLSQIRGIGKSRLAQIKTQVTL